MAITSNSRVKRWAPKTFGGCQTCKRRRIKCDETKPECQRCVRSGLQCEGYVPPQTRIFEPKRQEPVQDKQQAVVLRSSIASSASLTSTSSASTASIFSSSADRKSFEFFMRKTADLISVYSQHHFWAVIVPQATHRHDSIKHSVLALSVLHESLSQLGQLPIDQNKRLLHHYNEAIRAVTRSQPTTDVVLMTCVLFWTIENFRGGKKSSFDHLQAAVKILNEFKARDNYEASPHYEVIIKYIEPTIKDGLRHVPMKRIVDVTDGPEDYCHTIRALALRLPASMSTLEKATDYLRLCLQGVLALIEQGQTSQCILAVETLEEYLNRWIVPFLELAAVRSVCDRRLLVVHHVTALILLAELKKEYKMEEQDTVKTRSQYSWIVTETEDLVSHSEDLNASLQDPDAVARNLGLMPPLFTAAFQCPDPALRANALKILKEWDGREKGWSSIIAIKIAQTLAQLRDNERISFRLECISFESTAFGLRLYERAPKPRFDFFLGGSEEELAGTDITILESIVRSFGYQLEQPP